MRVNFATGEEEAAVAAKLGLEWDPLMQDWPIVVSDAARIDEFCAALAAASKRSDRICLVELVIASLDDYFEEYEPVEAAEVSQLVRRSQAALEPALREFPDIVEYWVEGHFPVKQVLKEILAETILCSRSARHDRG